MYMVDPGTLGRVCWARWAVVTAGRWPGVPGTGWHGTQATAETERPPCAERGSGCSGLFLCPNRRRRMVQRDSVRGAVERVMGPPIGRAGRPARNGPDERDGGGDRQSGSNLLVVVVWVCMYVCMHRARRKCPPADCTPSPTQQHVIWRGRRSTRRGAVSGEGGREGGKISRVVCKWPRAHKRRMGWDGMARRMQVGGG